MRVLTLNVHNPAGPVLEGIARFLDRSGAELIALTECRRPAAEALAERLGCAGLVHARAPFYGNALLSRTLALAPGPEVQLPASALGEPRSAALGAARVGDARVVFVATHLDYGPEEERLRQMRHLFDSSYLDPGACVLLGDLNALTRADYDDERWEWIAATRAGAELTPPSAELTDWLRGEQRFSDAHDARPPDAPFAPTCPFGTRVDYVLVGERCPLRPVPGSYRVLGAMAAGLTDHDAVAVELA